MSDQPDKNADPQDQEPDESSFWDKLGTMLDKKIDEGIERNIKARTKQTSRNGGRAGLPEWLAKNLGGPFTPVS